MRARANRSYEGLKVPGGLSASEEALGARNYTDWHWGHPPAKVVEWKDADMPKILTECGRLVRLSFSAPRDKHPRRERATMIQLSKQQADQCHIAYDPEHKYQRVYFLLSPTVRRVIQQRFWSDSKGSAMSLSSLAQIAGGHHATGDYPRVSVKPIGILQSVVYLTSKVSDPPCTFYIHKVGEVTHHYPILCADAKGRLWVAGGNYTSPTPGLTD